jgi:hypothetical protein
VITEPASLSIASGSELELRVNRIHTGIVSVGPTSPLGCRNDKVPLGAACSTDGERQVNTVTKATSVFFIQILVDVYFFNRVRRLGNIDAVSLLSSINNTLEKVKTKIKTAM